jgi:hypothetical protein
MMYANISANFHAYRPDLLLSVEDHMQSKLIYLFLITAMVAVLKDMIEQQDWH